MHIPFVSNSFLLWFITGYWVSFPVLYSRILSIHRICESQTLNLSLSLFPSTSAITSLFYISLFFPVSFCHILDSTYRWYHMSCFSFWITSLNMIISKSNHVAANGVVSFFFNGWVVFHSIYHILFIHSSVDGHLGCFRVLAIVHSYALNIRVHIAIW